ncbi:MAG: 30S ribosomal protein S9 [archaeon]
MALKGIIVSGKKKAAVAKAMIKEGDGKVTINKKSYEHLDFTKRLEIEEPLRIAKDVLKGLKYDISVKVKGGGNESQIEAARLAIARALVEASKSAELKKAFLAYDRNLLVADTRRKEPCKPGDSKARARRQKSYR